MGLIDCILEGMDMKAYNIKFTPADKEYLHKDKDRDPCSETCNYRSIVDIMLRLAEKLQLYIAYTVH